jgi:hypothetical protein
MPCGSVELSGRKLGTTCMDGSGGRSMGVGSEDGKVYACCLLFH